MARRYRKRPVVVEAVQFVPEDWMEMRLFANVGNLAEGKAQACYIDADGNEHASWVGRGFPGGLWLPTLEGVMLARLGDYVIKGVKGELYPCKPDIFEATYEPVGADGEAEE